MNLNSKGIFKVGLRLVPATMLLLGVATSAAPVGATGTSCPPAGAVSVYGGDLDIDSSVDLSADGGEADARANGGNHNRARALFGDGADARAGNGGSADADANGGTINVRDIRTGNNRGNTVSVFRSRGNVAVDGGDVDIDSSVDVSADGGEADAQANGGNHNDAQAGSHGGTGSGSRADAGNGGTADADANGGTITVRDIDTGGNRGNTIDVRGGGSNCSNTHRAVNVDGGDVAIDSSVDLSADGGKANAEANGGDNNDARARGTDSRANAGNGGDADADANGGTINVRDITTGNNRGNTVSVAGGGHGSVDVSGGDVDIDSSVDISADGGKANAEANGGDHNDARADEAGTANAGNGGTADADANGGTINVGNISTGNNRGNEVEVGATSGEVWVDGGDVDIDSSVDISADGGEADAQANGGNNNTADAGTDGQANAGNGGDADAQANGGTINVGNIDTGGNSGNDITVGS